MTVIARYLNKNNNRDSAFSQYIWCDNYGDLKRLTEWIMLASLWQSFVGFLAVTIYVRKEEEKAYNALMLETFTLNELKSAVSPFEKFEGLYWFWIVNEVFSHVFSA